MLAFHGEVGFLVDVSCCHNCLSKLDGALTIGTGLPNALCLIIVIFYVLDLKNGFRRKTGREKGICRSCTLSVVVLKNNNNNNKKQ